MKEELYNLEALKFYANLLIKGNTKVTNFEQIKEIFNRYGYSIEEINICKYRVIKK